jgi:hypothetical protein
MLIAFWPQLNHLAISPYPGASLQGEKIFQAGKDSTTMPSCHNLTDPAYSNEGRAANFNGTVFLEITIMLDQSVADTYLVRGVPFS